MSVVFCLSSQNAIADEDTGNDIGESPTHTILRDRGNRGKTNDKVFGHYRLAVGASKVTFTDLKNYEDFYGQTRPMPTLQVDYYFFDWFATIGATFRFNFYKDEGHAVQGNKLATDENGRTELTLIPLQAGIAVQGTPFRAKWIVLSGWFGAEATYYQEVREVEEDSGSASATTTDGESTIDEGQYVNDGWKYSSAMGFSANFLLNYLDGQSTSSLRSIGIGGVFLSPYMEIVRSTKKEGLTFSRSAYGIAFTFETI